MLPEHKLCLKADDWELKKENKSDQTTCKLKLFKLQMHSVPNKGPNLTTTPSKHPTEEIHPQSIVSIFRHLIRDNTFGVS